MTHIHKNLPPLRHSNLLAEDRVRHVGPDSHVCIHKSHVTHEKESCHMTHIQIPPATEPHRLGGGTRRRKTPSNARDENQSYPSPTSFLAPRPSCRPIKKAEAPLPPLLGVAEQNRSRYCRRLEESMKCDGRLGGHCGGSVRGRSALEQEIFSHVRSMARKIYIHKCMYIYTCI